MADSIPPAGETGGSEGDQPVEIELEPALASEEAQDGDESPPDYTTILGEEGPPPLDYEEALAADSLTPHSKKTLTAEAPPSYRQLFGKGEEPDGHGHTPFRQRRRHTIRRHEGQRSTTQWRRFMDKIPKDTKTTVKIVLISAVVVVGVCLTLSMIIVGFLNIEKCAAQNIPLYLIVAGFIILTDLLLHTLLCIGQKCSEDETVFQLLRRCDCCAFFLFVWLLVGSTWMFRAGAIRDQAGCRQAVDDVVIANSSDIVVHVSVDGSGMLGPAPTDCEDTDCSSGVYAFAAMLLLIQYVVALALVVCCCTSTLRSRRS